MKPINRILSSYLDRFDPEGKNYLFVQICQHWSQVVGSELAALARPLGRKKNTLILGAEDSLVIQEITLQQSEILNRISLFCGVDLFDRLRVELLKGRTPLDSTLVNRPEPGYVPPRPENLGDLMPFLPKNTTLTRCYARYVNFFKKQPK